MNRYETVFIIDPDVTESDEQAIIDRVRSLVAKENGKLAAFDDWGRRKFAYEIRKKKQGHYIRIEYGGSGDLVQAIERFFKIDYRLLKFMTICLEKNIDPEALPTAETETSRTASTDDAEPAAETVPEQPEAAESAQPEKPAAEEEKPATESETKEA